jgi:hypothetical protein
MEWWQPPEPPVSEAEFSACCREKGLFPEQIQRWKAACLHGGRHARGE